MVELLAMKSNKGIILGEKSNSKCLVLGGRDWDALEMIDKSSCSAMDLFGLTIVIWLEQVQG